MNRHDSKGKALGPGDVCYVRTEMFTGSDREKWGIFGSPMVVTVLGAASDFMLCVNCAGMNAVEIEAAHICGCILTKIDPDEVAHEAEKDECLTA